MLQPHGSRRVAFFGGSFDPPHLGHLAVARAARRALQLDTVLFTPVGAQPLKPQGSTASFDHRLAMTRLAIEGEEGFAISLADVPRTSGEPNFTLDTLQILRSEMPEAQLFCLMGADSFLGLHKWRHAAEIPLLASLIVASRPGQPLGQVETALPRGLRLEPVEEREVSGIAVRLFTVIDPSDRRAPFYLLPGLDVEISASAIRAQLACGSASGLVPPAVAEYIRAHRLYR